MLLELVGALAAALSVAVSIPQLVRVVRAKHANGVSATAWSLMLAAAVCWASYGLLAGLPAEVGCNVAAVAINFAVIGIAAFHGHPTMLRRATLATFGAGAVVTAGVLTDARMVALAAITMGAAVYVPHVINLRRAGDVSGIAPGTFVVNAAAASLWVAYGLGHADALIWLPCIPSVVASMALAHHVTRRQAPIIEFPTTEVVAIAA